MPVDCLAIQAGEALQILTGGKLVALPSAISISKEQKKKDLRRNSFTMYMGGLPESKLDLPKGVNPDSIFKVDDSKFGIIPLRNRWTPGMTY